MVYSDLFFCFPCPSNFIFFTKNVDCIKVVWAGSIKNTWANSAQAVAASFAVNNQPANGLLATAFFF